MSDLYFLNARLRSLRSSLLPPAAYARLLFQPDLAAFAAALRETPYGRALEETGGEPGDVARMEEALRRELSGSLVRLLAMGREDCREAVRRLLGFLELRTLRAIVRGMCTKRPAAEILAALVPAGIYDEAALEALCRQHDVRDVALLLLGWGDPNGATLLRSLAGYREPSDAWMLETALDRAFFKANAPPREADDDLALFLSLAADRTNLATALSGVAERIAPDRLRRCFLPGGRVYRAADFAHLVEAASVGEAAERAARSVFAPVLEGLTWRPGGVPQFPVLERALDRVLLQCMRMRMRVEPLGTAPLVCWLLDKFREVANLRLIFRGRLAGMTAADLAILLSAEG